MLSVAVFYFSACTNVTVKFLCSYKSELDTAGECLILMMEQNPKEVMGSTCIQIIATYKYTLCMCLNYTHYICSNSSADCCGSLVPRLLSVFQSTRCSQNTMGAWSKSFHHLRHTHGRFYQAPSFLCEHHYKTEEPGYEATVVACNV